MTPSSVFQCMCGHQHNESFNSAAENDAVGTMDCPMCGAISTKIFPTPMGAAQSINSDQDFKGRMKGTDI